MPPCTFGCSVTTRWPRIAGTPVSSATSVTGSPASASARAVPPLDTSRQPSSCSPRPSSTIPDLSYTESNAVGTAAEGNESSRRPRNFGSTRRISCSFGSAVDRTGDGMDDEDLEARGPRALRVPLFLLRTWRWLKSIGGVAVLHRWSAALVVVLEFDVPGLPRRQRLRLSLTRLVPYVIFVAIASDDHHRPGRFGLPSVLVAPACLLARRRRHRHRPRRLPLLLRRVRRRLARPRHVPRPSPRRCSCSPAASSATGTGAPRRSESTTRRRLRRRHPTQHPSDGTLHRPSPPTALTTSRVDVSRFRTGDWLLVAAAR